MDNNELLYDVMKNYGAEYRIGQKVVIGGKEDEIEAFCPLWMNSFNNGKPKQEYIGMGYNLKHCRKTVMANEFLITPENIDLNQ